MSVTIHALRSAPGHVALAGYSVSRDWRPRSCSVPPCGLVVGLIVWLWRNNGAAAFVIGGSIALSLVTAVRVCPGRGVTSASIQAGPKKLRQDRLHCIGGFFLRGDLFHQCVAGFCDEQRLRDHPPRLNEEEPIAGVVRECLATGLPNEVIVVDNGSTDRTAERARGAGARVVTALRGSDARAPPGVRALSPKCDIVVFLDGDGSDAPAFMNQLVEPVARGRTIS